MHNAASTLRRALGAACIAAATSAGLIVGAGRRSGDPMGPFLLAGRALLDSRGVANLLVPAATTLIGALHHLTAVVLWGTLIAFVASALRPLARVPIVAVAVAAIAWAGAVHLPVLGRLDLPVGAALRWPLHAAVAIALLIGLWAVAPSRRTSR